MTIESKALITTLGSLTLALIVLINGVFTPFTMSIIITGYMFPVIILTLAGLNLHAIDIAITGIVIVLITLTSGEHPVYTFIIELGGSIFYGVFLLFLLFLYWDRYQRFGEWRKLLEYPKLNYRIGALITNGIITVSLIITSFNNGMYFITTFVVIMYVLSSCRYIFGTEVEAIKSTKR